MRDVKIGLRTTFRSITDTSLLRLVFDRYAPSARADWNLAPDKLPDCLFTACKKLRESASSEYENLIAALQDICDVCTDRKSIDALSNAITDAKTKNRFRAAVKKGKRELQNAAVWMMLNLPESWQHVLVASRAGRIDAKGWDEYEAGKMRIPSERDNQKFSDEVAKYLHEETLHGEHVHIESDNEGEIFRHFVSISNLPTNVQQFTTKGEYVIRHDQNAVNFMFEYNCSTGIVRLRCPLDVNKRRALAKIYSEIILRCDMKKTSKQAIDLSRHLENHILPMANDARILGVRQASMEVEYLDKAGCPFRYKHETQGRGNLSEYMCKVLSVFGVPVSDATVTEVGYDITLAGTHGTPKVIRLKLTPKGVIIGSRTPKDREIIDSYVKKLLA